MDGTTRAGAWRGGIVGVLLAGQILVAPELDGLRGAGRAQVASRWVFTSRNAPCPGRKAVGGT